jgi:hypothetical protein
MQTERAELHRLIERLRPAGWISEMTAEGARLDWYSGHLETVSVTAAVVAEQPALEEHPLRVVHPLGRGWLVLGCDVSDAEHPRAWAAIAALVAGLAQIA